MFKLNSYELMIIFDPNLGEEKIGAMVGKVEDKIKSLKGEISKTDKWGARRLASVMHKAKKLRQGFYVLIYFKSDPSVPAQVQALLKVTENVVRYSVMRAGEAPVAAPGGEIEAVNVGEIKAEPAPAPEESGGQS